MPIKHASIKDLRKSKKRAAQNLRMKTHLKSLSKKLKAAVAAGKKDEVREIAKILQQSAAKAAKNNVVHKNKAQRLTSFAIKNANA